LNAEGHEVGRRHVATLMKKMGIEALYRRPNTSKPAPGHKVYPYLLRKLEITGPNQVWAMDITYVPMARGFVYLAAVIDWYSRRVLAWRVLITMTADFCVAALEEALARHGKPDICNTDQGSQFTGAAFTAVLHEAGVQISMDGKGAWRDNVFAERRAQVRHRFEDDGRAAVGEIRGGLPACLRQRLRGQDVDWAVPDLLQRDASPFGAWRTDARPGILQPVKARPGCSITSVETHSTTGHKLFRSAEPALRSSEDIFLLFLEFVRPRSASLIIVVRAIGPSIPASVE
jgi:putative transposase